MLPTDVLKSEHRVIEQVLDVLEKIAGRAAYQGVFDTASAAQALDFFRNFADRCHHGKEEEQLFPALEAKGFDRDSGPTGVMCHEHEQGRALIRGMAEAVDAAPGDREAGQRFSEYARAYLQMLRIHIHKEDHCLFSMADQALGADDQEALMRRFERVEAEDMGVGTHERYLQLANELAERYDVKKAGSAGGHDLNFTCSHHAH